MRVAKKLELLQKPQFQESIEIMCNPTFIEGLCRIQNLGSERVPPETNNMSASGFRGTLANIPVTPSPSQGNRNFDPSTLGLHQMAAPQMHSQMPNPEQPIKLEDTPSVGKPLSMEDFNTILRPKVGSLAASKPPKHTYTPHGKSVTPTKKSHLGSFEDMQGLAELKRKAIRECNIALKANKLTNDPDSVIWNETRRLNRDIIIGP